MTCKKARQWLSVLIDGELSQERQGELDSHLRECRACQQELLEFRQLQEDLARLPRREVPDHFAASIMREIQPVQKYRLFTLPSLVYSLVFLLFFGLGFFLSIGNGKVSGENKSQSTYSKVLVESQDLNLVSLEGKMLAMSCIGGRDEN